MADNCFVQILGAGAVVTVDEDAQGGGFVPPARPGVDRVEVRLLGALQVRRVDGSVVSPRDWRTGKTADLLRLLALSGGELVPVSRLLDALWPAVDEARARASLRTAASHLRKVLGPDSVQRHQDGLRLVGAWVDAVAFAQLAAEAGRSRRGGRLAACVRTTREAQALYVEDFAAHDATAQWAQEWRRQLADDYREMLTDAAEAAVELGWMRDAVELATQVLARDDCSERAYRALMQGYAGLGETDRALRAYERCRTLLAEGLGADPAPLTQAVHLQVLRAEPVSVDAAPWTGRHAELQWLAQVLESVAAGGTSVVVRLTGRPGTGRHRLVEEAARLTGVRELVPASGVRAADLVGQLGGEAVVVVLPEAELAEAPDCDERVRAVLTAGSPVALVLTADADQPTLPLPADLPVEVRQLAIQPLTAAEIAALAAGRLGERVSPQLTDELMAVCAGNPDRALAALAAWSADGRITATAGGLVLAAEHSGETAHDDAEPLLARIVDRLDAAEIEVLALTALLEAPASAPMLAELLSGPADADRRHAVRVAVEHLADLGVVTTAESGVTLRDPVLRPAVEAWLRPSVRHRLHVRIAEQARVSPAERVRHWVAAGETELACAASYDAARRSADEGRWADAHDQLQQVWRLADPDAAPADRVDLHERLGDACTALGRREEAREAYVAATGLARAHRIDGLDRLTAKLDGLVAPNRPRDPGHGTGGEASAPDGAPLDHGDWAAALDEVETVLLPRRDLAGARHTASLVAARAVDPALRARAVLLAHLPDLLLGEPAAVNDALRDAAAEARLAGAHDAARPLEMALALAAHDCGEVAWRLVEPEPGTESEAWAWSTVRVLTERGDLADAAALEPRLPLPSARPLIRQLGLLAAAELRLAAGERLAAVTTLDTLLDEALRDGTTLFVPVVAARLVCLVAADDAAAAHDYFDLLDLATGPAGDLPRERVWRQLARAEIRAATGRERAAAASAGIAGKLAGEIGVLPLAARAESRRAAYLRDAGALVESRLAAAEAARLRARGGLAEVDPPAAAERPAPFGRARLKMASVAGELVALSGGMSGAALSASGFF